MSSFPASSRLLALTLVTAMSLSVGVASAHQTRAVDDGTVRAQPSNGAALVNVLHDGQLVEVVECDRGPVWCFLVLPGADGWARASLLAHPLQPQLPCPPACKH